MTYKSCSFGHDLSLQGVISVLPYALVSCYWHVQFQGDKIYNTQRKCLLPITLHIIHILNKQMIQKYRYPKTVTYGQTVPVLFLVKNMYLGQQAHYDFVLFYGWLSMTGRSHRKLHSAHYIQYSTIALLHRECTTHADKIISQRASNPHITQVFRCQAALWLEYFVFFFLPRNCSVEQSVPQPSLADPGVRRLDAVGSEPLLGSLLALLVPYKSNTPVQKPKVH